MVDTYLSVSNLPIEHLIQDDEAIRGMRCIPFNQHIRRLGYHDLMDHRAWDVICFFCEYKTYRKTLHTYVARSCFSTLFIFELQPTSVSGLICGTFGKQVDSFWSNEFCLCIHNQNCLPSFQLTT